MSRHILVVEDDASIGLGLQMNLEAEGYRVTLAGDGITGLELAQQGGVDLLILDVMLPRLNGFELLRQLRAAGTKIPVIVLSARDAELDIVMGLEVGAEDYVTKPFGLAELLARVKVVLRRAASAQPPVEGDSANPDSAPRRLAVVRAGALEIDPNTRQVLRAGAAINLTATEFDVLWCLAAAGGSVLSREEIQTRVWGPEHHGTLRTIDNFLMQLRTKLEVDPTEPKTLLTVRGVGYRLVVS